MFKKIVLPLDFDTEATWKKALPLALDLIKNYGCELHLINIVPDFGATMVSNFFPADFEHKIKDHAETALHSFRETHVPADTVCSEHIRVGRIYEEIVSLSNEIQADCIVMASHHPEVSDYLIGPNASRVVRHADCTVMIIRE